MSHKTPFHELAHVLLGHTTEGEQNDGEFTPRSLRECEAEAVALLCCAALDLPGVEVLPRVYPELVGERQPDPGAVGSASATSSKNGSSLSNAVIRQRAPVTATDARGGYRPHSRHRTCVEDTALLAG